MQKKTVKSKPLRKRFLNFIPVIIILILLTGIPLLILVIQSGHSGLSMGEIVTRILNKKRTEVTQVALPGEQDENTKKDFLVPAHIGITSDEKPQISHVQASDLDKDGLLDVIVCDALGDFVSWIRQYPAGTYTEKVLAGGLIAPAHVQVIDFDGDGDNDILVAVLGMLFPNNDKIGSVVILENDGKNNFTKRAVIEKIARVSDVRGGDLDGDGDMDLAVAQFGYDDGETRWIENLGNWRFRHHILQSLSGPINVEIIDIDKDGDLDIISLVSQEWEEIYCFLNDGSGKFQTKLLYGSSNEDFGSSGIYMSDIDRDGDDDILYTNGDAFDYIPPVPRPWHGVNWLENKGDLTFAYHRIATYAGAYNARPVDIDGDNDLDIFVVSSFHFWDKPGSMSFIWLDNDGKMKFTVRNITNNPTHILTLETGDFNDDGKTDFITGGMHTYPPFDRTGRIILWTNKGL